MSKVKKPLIVQHVEVQVTAHKSKFIEVHNRNTPLFDYHKAKRNINSDIKALKHEIWRSRLLKVQAYIAYRLTQ